jgi:hypothetical protein
MEVFLNVVIEVEGKIYEVGFAMEVIADCQRIFMLAGWLLARVFFPTSFGYFR